MKHVALVFVLLAAPAYACLNNSDTVVSEQEFNKRYEAPGAVAGPSDPMAALRALGGVALLVAGAGIVRRRLRG